MANALILAGGREPYVDPWHPFAATAGRLAELLGGLGHNVEVAEDVGGRLGDLSGVDLLVSNAPVPTVAPDPGEFLAAESALAGFVARGGGILGAHIGVTTLLGLPQWTALLGVRWIPGVTMHPPIGRATVSARPDPRAGSIREFMLEDERYTRLAIEGEIVTIVEHEFEGASHPLVWAREAGGTRVIGDALGHGPASYDSPEHREILERSVRWLIRED